MVSAQFSSALDERIADRQLSAEASAAVDSAKEQPLSGGDVGDVPAAEAAALDDDIVDSSESAFHLGMLIATVLMVVGGVIALLGVRNPERPPDRAPAPGPGRSRDRGRVRANRRRSAPAARGRGRAEPRPLLTPGRRPPPLHSPA